MRTRDGSSVKKGTKKTSLNKNSENEEKDRMDKSGWGVNSANCWQYRKYKKGYTFLPIENKLPHLQKGLAFWFHRHKTSWFVKMSLQGLLGASSSRFENAFNLGLPFFSFFSSFFRWNFLSFFLNFEPSSYPL